MTIVAEGRIKPPTTQEAVLTQLRHALAGGVLRPGDQVRQEQLADRYGVSRVPVREALKILEGEGRVAYHPHRGYFVAELSVADLLEVYRLRELLEAEAITAAVPRLTDLDLSRMRAAAQRVHSAGGRLAQVSRANRQFHFLLFDASGRPVLTRMLGQLWDATDVHRTVYFGEKGNRDRIDAEHDQQLDALATRDTHAVVRLQAKHRARSAAVIRAALQ